MALVSFHNTHSSKRMLNFYNCVICVFNEWALSLV